MNSLYKDGIEQSKLFKDRLSEAMSFRGHTIYSLSKGSGISTGSLHNLLKGGLPRLDTLLLLSNYLNTSLEWLASGEETPSELVSAKEPSIDEPTESFFKVMTPIQRPPIVAFPLFDTSKTFTLPIILNASGEADDFEITLTADWLMANCHRLDTAALFLLKSDSMYPALLKDELVMVDLSDTKLEDDQIYLINTYNVLSVKRCQRLKHGGFVFYSDNRTYRDQLIVTDALDGLEVIGRLVWSATNN